ncbi:transcription termination factor MTERF15, mitochondrial-like [Rutidosis leptorrhynchoides]|uniref:transcription termination factor MTERF15, mitochondrial-like n=1 Tax=Rutidosis leptorrhynchoides TaxID=125765 RepID=UPI003A99FDB0
MAIELLTRRNLHNLSLHSHKQIQNLIKTQSFLFSANPNSHPENNSQYRKQVSLANLLQRYGFSQPQLHSFLKRSHFLLNSNLHDIEKSFGMLLSFKIPQKPLVSLIYDCPAVLDYEFLKKWEVGVSKFGNLGVLLSPLAHRNVLESSKKFQVDPDEVCRAVNVLKGLGFCNGTVNRVLEGFSRLVLMKDSEIYRKVDYLVKFGIRREGVDRVLNLFPGILGLGIEDRLNPLLDEFRDLGFCKNMVRNEIIREPKILSMELGELSRCLEMFRTLKCREPIKYKIFSEGVFRAGIEVKLRVDCLCNHGLIRREAFKVLWKEPRVIVYDIKDIEKKIEFLVSRMRFDIGCLVEVPEYLGVNFEKQIVPRYNVIEYLNSKGALDCEVRLKDMIKLSRLRFFNLFVKPYPECERFFTRFTGDVPVRKQTVGLWKLFKPQKQPNTEDDSKAMRSFMESLV